MTEVFSKYKEIKKAIIYGSRAKGNFSPGSDIDICIVAPTMTFSRYLILLAEIDELDIPQKVDLTKFELLDDNIISEESAKKSIEMRKIKIKIGLGWNK